ncbi:MAG: phytanoyl-CoA dioxygenase family protein [Planctomycetales bacterium]|nr:phytanoyl-CoA dioxygenase family protein [Planctomycetales bacterium]
MIKVDELGNPTPEQLAALPRTTEFIPCENDNPSTLTQAQIRQYNELGFLFPFEGLGQSEIAELRAFFDGLLAAFIELGRDSYSINTAHLRFAKIYKLMSHPAIIEPVSDLLGPNVVAWGSHFFCKLPHDGKRVDWHQDCTYWPLSPTKTVTVWLAIDDADPENANMQFIPRSHLHGLIKYQHSDDAKDILGMVVDNPEQYGDAAVDATLRAGQFSMHSDQLLHGSGMNESDRRRCGLTIRYASADVRAWYGWDQKGIVVKGTDALGNWANLPAPEH